MTTSSRLFNFIIQPSNHISINLKKRIRIYSILKFINKYINILLTIYNITIKNNTTYITI